VTPVHKSADLCWGQRYIWLRHHQLPPHARHEQHIVITFEIPEGSALAGVKAMLNYLVRRHEALRTTYHLDAPGGPQQRVHPPAPLPVVTVSTERDGTASPADVVERLSTTEFDLASEWPIRAIVLTTAGAPRQAVVVLNHMAFDAWTVDQFERELVALRTGATSGRPANLAPVRYQPVDLAKYESSAGAGAVKDRALAYWRDEIAQAPADCFAGRRVAAPANDGEPVARAATLTSPTLLEATRQIAAQHQTWPSLVHLTAYAMVTAAYTGSSRIAHLAFTGNRGENSYADVMTCLFSPLLLRVECDPEVGFRELLRRGVERFEEGQRYANVPYDELVELLARESARRREWVRVGAEVNFLSHASHSARARRTTFTWNATPSAWATSGADSYFRIIEMRDAVVLGLHACSAVFDADAVEQFLRGYEQVILAVQDPAVDLRVADVAGLVGFADAAHPVGFADAAHPVGFVPPLLQDHPGELAGEAEASGAATAALAAAVADVNGLSQVDTGLGYVVAGGRVLLIPGVLAKLRDAGWEGLSVYQLASPQSLDTLATQLVTAAATVAR
jgi:Condensation domain